jgi:hypothetical protein
MTDLTPDRMLLTHLSQFGLGRYANITPLLIKIFPESALVKSYPAQQVIGREMVDFLQSLVKENLIEIRADAHLKLLAGNSQEYTTLKSQPIHARLLTNGLKLLNQTQAAPATHIIVSGDHNIVANHSPSTQVRTYAPSYSNPSAGIPITVAPEKKKGRSLVEMIAWLTGIAASLILIGQTFLHTDTAFKNPVPIADSAKGPAKDSLQAKHISSIIDHSTTRTAPFHFPSRNRPATIKSRPDTTKNNAGIGPSSKSQLPEQKATSPEDVNNLPLKAVQRHVDLFDIRDLQSRIKDKRSNIHIFCGNNKECKIYAAEIRKSLDSLGYAVAPKIIFALGDYKAVKRCEVAGVAEWISITVYPQFQY